MADPASFIADMNALQGELAAMDPKVADAICRLMEIIDLQNENIATMLKVNRALLDELDRLKG
jgi:hypothetical protein